MSLRIATRGSALALAQARLIADRLPAAELVEVGADPGPGSGDKERFTRGVERAILDGAAELGVHSAKDLPGEMTPGLAIAAVPERADPRDAWLGAGDSLEAIPAGARVGTVSPRRRSQLLARRPDLVPVEMHGNVDSRITRLRAGEVDGLVLAMAGLIRLGREDEAAFVFGLDEMTPAAGQGTLMLQGRAAMSGGSADGARAETGDADAAAAIAALGDEASARSLAAERTAIVRLGADCASPVGIHAREEGGRLVIDGYVGLPDGSAWLRDRVEGDPLRARRLGAELADRMLAAGGAELIAEAGG